MIRLTIVIPAYNAEPYIYELLDCLAPQITDEVEVIVIDDGSRQQVTTDHKWCKVIRQKNQGCSTARNKGPYSPISSTPVTWHHTLRASTTASSAWPEHATPRSTPKPIP